MQAESKLKFSISVCGQCAKAGAPLSRAPIVLLSIHIASYPYFALSFRLHNAIFIFLTGHRKETISLLVVGSTLFLRYEPPNRQKFSAAPPRTTDFVKVLGGTSLRSSSQAGPRSFSKTRINRPRRQRDGRRYAPAHPADPPPGSGRSRTWRSGSRGGRAARPAAPAPDRWPS